MLECYYCKRGLENLCEDLLFNNGAYAEYIRIPGRIVERNTYDIPAHVSYQDAALIEPLACVMRGLEETAHPSRRYRGRHRAGSHRPDVREAGEGVRRARDRRRPAADTAGSRRAHGRRRIAVDTSTGETRSRPSATDQRPRRGYRHRSRRQAGDLALAVNMVRRGGTVNFFGGCPNESTVNWTRLCCTTPKSPAKRASITRRCTSGRRWNLVCRGDITAQRFRQPRRAADQPAGSDAPPDEPQRPPEDGHHSLASAWCFWLLRISSVRRKRWPKTYTVAEAEAYTRWLATHHYENFHMVSFLLPKRLHQDFYNVYAYCRWADDLGDEIGDTRGKPAPARLVARRAGRHVRRARRRIRSSWR